MDLSILIKNQLNILGVVFYKKSMIEQLYSNSEPTHLFSVKDGATYFIVKFEDLLFVQGLKDYVILHTVQQKFVIKRTLKDLITRLPTQFMRVHQSYIVNLFHVKKMEEGLIYLSNQQVPWGKNYRACALRRIQQIAI